MAGLAIRTAERSGAQAYEVVARCPGDELIGQYELQLVRTPDGRWLELMVFGPGRVEVVEVSPTMAEWLIRHYEGRALVAQARAQARGRRGAA